MVFDGLQAIVFDFDGVLVESVSIKGEAFVELYKNESPEVQKKVLAYHEQYGGVSRFDKIRYYETELCGREIDEKEVNRLANKFSDIVEELVVKADWVPGALEFVRDHHNIIPLYVVSATPEEELVRIVHKRNIFNYFKGIFGSPKKKGELINAIAEANGYNLSRIIMIGDAMTDYNAAQKTDAQFIGRLLPCKNSPFPDGTILINDLTELDRFIKLTI